MSDSRKIIAPRPIRASSNIKGVKINFGESHEFEKINLGFNTLTPKLKMSCPREMKLNNQNQLFSAKSQTALNEMHTSKTLNTISPLNKMNTLNENNYFFQIDESTFDRTVEKDFQILKNNDNSISKSEILAILKSDSFNLESRMFRCMDEDVDNILLFDDIRTSMPPIRSKNSFYKNFENVKYKNINDDEHNDFYSKIGECYDPK